MIAEQSEVVSKFLSIQSKRREVVAFLDELQMLLGKEDFDINTDINLISKEETRGKSEIFDTIYIIGS